MFLIHCVCVAFRLLPKFDEIVTLDFVRKNLLTKLAFTFAMLLLQLAELIRRIYS